MPLLAAIGLLIMVPFTLGASVFLAPVGIGLTLMAARRVAAPRGLVFWCGAVVNGWLAVGFVVALGLIVHDTLVA